MPSTSVFTCPDQPSKIDRAGAGHTRRLQHPATASGNNQPLESSTSLTTHILSEHSHLSYPFRRCGGTHYYIYRATWPRDIRPPGRNPGESVEGHRTHIPRRTRASRGHTNIVVPSKVQPTYPVPTHPLPYQAPEQSASTLPRPPAA